MKDEIFSFRIETEKGTLFFDLKEDENVKITQSRHVKADEFEMQSIVLKKAEVQKLRDAVDVAVREFDKYDSRSNKSREHLPANAYKPWSNEDDFELQLLLKQNKTVKEIAKEMNRTRGSIESRIRRFYGIVD